MIIVVRIFSLLLRMCAQVYFDILSGHLTREVFAPMLKALEEGGDETRTLFKEQFPRQKALTALFMYDVKKKSPTNAAQLLVRHSHMCWQVFCMLHVAAKPRDLCWRRGCSAKGTARCGFCKVVRYCGPQCQKKYVLHDMLGDWMINADNFLDEGTGRSTSSSVREGS